MIHTECDSPKCGQIGLEGAEDLANKEREKGTETPRVRNLQLENHELSSFTCPAWATYWGRGRELNTHSPCCPGASRLARRWTPTRQLYDLFNYSAGKIYGEDKGVLGACITETLSFIWRKWEGGKEGGTEGEKEGEVRRGKERELCHPYQPSSALGHDYPWNKPLKNSC